MKRKSSHKKTLEEKNWIEKVISIGCIICRMPCEIHHLRHGMGIGQRNNHLNSIGLCPSHHRIGGYGIAFHAGKKAFEKKFGTETELLEKTKKIISDAAPSRCAC